MPKKKKVTEVILVEKKKGSPSEAPFTEVDGTVRFCTIYNHTTPITLKLTLTLLLFFN